MTGISSGFENVCQTHDKNKNVWQIIISGVQTTVFIRILECRVFKNKNFPKNVGQMGISAQKYKCSLKMKTA